MIVISRSASIFLEPARVYGELVRAVFNHQVEEREGFLVGQIESHAKYRQNASIPTIPSTKISASVGL